MKIPQKKNSRGRNGWRSARRAPRRRLVRAIHPWRRASVATQHSRPVRSVHFCKDEGAGGRSGNKKKTKKEKNKMKQRSMRGAVAANELSGTAFRACSRSKC
uniref:Uncharacterized protein n=1 Tax=Caenorhabditis japonica TaxID=281687 RepID=A0A8R1ES12_CAEJA